VDHLEVVDVDPDSQDLAVVEGLGEDAVVGVVELLEVLLEEPVEELALEAAAGLLMGLTTRAMSGSPSGPSSTCPWAWLQ